jgi:hypothetical protein
MQLDTMADTSKTGLLARLANPWLELHEPPSIVLKEGDLIAMRVFFELLAEWESKEAKNANLDQN